VRRQNRRHRLHRQLQCIGMQRGSRPGLLVGDRSSHTGRRRACLPHSLLPLAPLSHAQEHGRLIEEGWEQSCRSVCRRAMESCPWRATSVRKDSVGRCVFLRTCVSFLHVAQSLGTDVAVTLSHCTRDFAVTRSEFQTSLLTTNKINRKKLYLQEMHVKTTGKILFEEQSTLGLQAEVCFVQRHIDSPYVHAWGV